MDSKSKSKSKSGSKALARYKDDAAEDAGDDYESSDGEAVKPLVRKNGGKDVDDEEDEDDENDEDRAFIASDDESDGEAVFSDVGERAAKEAVDADAAVAGIKRRHAHQKQLDAGVTAAANTAALAARDKAAAAAAAVKGGTTSAALKTFFTRPAVTTPTMTRPEVKLEAEAAKRKLREDAPEVKRARKAESDSDDGSDNTESESESESDNDDEPARKPAPAVLKHAAASVGASVGAVGAAKTNKPTLPGGGEDSESEKSKPRRVTGNKTLADPLIPPKPAAMAARTYGVTSDASDALFDDGRRFRFRLILTNAANLLKFLSGIIKVVPQMRIHLVSGKNFQGFRIEAHDASRTLAVKSRYKCDLVPGVFKDGSALDTTALNGISFCINSETFALCLKSAAMKEANMYITQYYATREHETAEDDLAFESITDEGVSYCEFYCSTIGAADLQSLAGMQVKSAYHQEITLHVLKELCTQAKDAKAPVMTFEVARCADPDDASVMHSRLRVGFVGIIRGGQNFFVSMRRTAPKASKDGAEVMDWQMLTDIPKDRYTTLPWTAMCVNEYDSRKLRVFLRTMEGDWVWIHLSPDMPLIMDVSTADKSTQHMIIVAPKAAEDS